MSVLPVEVPVSGRSPCVGSTFLARGIKVEVVGTALCGAVVTCVVLVVVRTLVVGVLVVVATTGQAVTSVLTTNAGCVVTVNIPF